MLVGSTEIDVVVEDCSTLMGIVQKAFYLWTDNVVQRVVGTKEYDVIWLDIRIVEVQTWGWSL